MAYLKTYKNGLKLVVKKIEGLMSVSIGVIVKTGSINETEEDNGISHFIEHTVFKGTGKRSAYEISDYIDGIGAQINAFTSKELTCYYTKSTLEHARESAEVLSDILFNATFDEKELEREKGVIIEEINMSEDTPEDLCMDVLAESYYGNVGLGRTILGPEENIKRFNKNDVLKYMDKYYTADNIVISFAGNIEPEEAEKITDELFANNFTRIKSAPQISTEKTITGNLFKQKKIEQAHVAFCFPTFKLTDERSDALNIANVVFGGGMSSRLFQKIREKMGLAYSVYSYPSQYKESGVVEIYAGVNVKSRDKASKAIISEIENFKKNGITEREFLRGKEQIKSSFILGKESTASQMLLYGKYLTFTGELFDFNKRLSLIDDVSIEEVNRIIGEYFDTSKLAVATVGPIGTPIEL